tara:strand:- start:5912 stop:6070 length:159 start_codon:yes stop_codon:yes gene_type:complete
MKEIERLCKYYKISEDLGLMVKVQTLISKHNQNYDTILDLYKGAQVKQNEEG